MKLLITGLLAFSVLSAAAQTTKIDSMPAPKHQIHLSMLDIMDPFSPAFMLGYERRIGSDYSALLEAGYITSFNGKWGPEKVVEGFKLRGELRLFRKELSHGDRAFSSLQAMYKYVSKPSLTGKFCMQNCAYFEEIDYRFKKQVVAVNFMIGRSVHWGRHIMMDLGAFIGVHRRIGKLYGIPEDATLQEDDIFWVDLDRERKEDSAGLRLGVVFRLGFGW